MKKVALITASLGFGLALLAVSVLNERVGVVWAEVGSLEQNMSEEIGMIEEEETTESAEVDESKIEGLEPAEDGDEQVKNGAVMSELEEEEGLGYYLPYPGILPDHPLYWLKMVRDRLLLWLTQGAVDKVERLLLYADKRIGAAEVLAEGNKFELAVTTATKAEKYLEQVVGELEGMRDSNAEVDELIEKVRRAHLRHELILNKLLDQAPESAYGIIDQALGIVESGKETIDSWLGNQETNEEVQEEVVMEDDEGASESAEGENEEEPVELIVE